MSHCPRSKICVKVDDCWWNDDSLMKRSEVAIPDDCPIDGSIKRFRELIKKDD